MKPELLALGLGIGAILLTAQGLRAEGATCLLRAEMVAELAGRYGETRRAIGLAGPTQVVEVFASEATGSWTITVTTPEGRSCLLAAGDHFEALEEALAPPGDPA